MACCSYPQPLPVGRKLPTTRTACCSPAFALQDSEHKVYYHYLVQDTPGEALQRTPLGAAQAGRRFSWFILRTDGAQCKLCFRRRWVVKHNSVAPRLPHVQVKVTVAVIGTATCATCSCYAISFHIRAGYGDSTDLAGDRRLVLDYIEDSCCAYLQQARHAAFLGRQQPARQCRVNGPTATPCAPEENLSQSHLSQ